MRAGNKNITTQIHKQVADNCILVEPTAAACGACSLLRSAAEAIAVETVELHYYRHFIIASTFKMFASHSNILDNTLITSLYSSAHSKIRTSVKMIEMSHNSIVVFAKL